MKVKRLYQATYLVLFLILLFSILQTVLVGSRTVSHGSNLSEFEQEIEEKTFLKIKLNTDLSRQLSIETIEKEAILSGYIPITQPLIIYNKTQDE